MAAAKAGTRQDAVNKATPALAKAKVGDVVQELIDQVNSLTAKVNTLTAKLDLDAGVTDTNYTALCAVPAVTIKSMELR